MPSFFVGQHHRVSDYYEVGREKIREFARAVQDQHPVHRDEKAARDLGYDGLVAPATFISILGLLTQRELFENVFTEYDFSQILQTAQVLEYHRPIVAGDRLHCDVFLESFRQIQGKDLIVTKNVITDQHNMLVQETYTTIVALTGEDVDPSFVEAVEHVMMHGMSLSERRKPIDGAGGPPPIEPAQPEPTGRTPMTTPAFADLAVGQELPTKTVRLTRGDLVNYAGVVGDPNPIHWSDGVATLVGLPNVVAHGMLTMGLGAGFVTEWLGDPTALAKFSVRFAGIAPVDPHRAGEIDFTGRIKSLDPERRTATIVLTAMSAGKKLFGLATAEVRLR